MSERCPFCALRNWWLNRRYRWTRRCRFKLDALMFGKDAERCGYQIAPPRSYMHFECIRPRGHVGPHESMAWA